jgi:hypothetical protein
MFLRILALLVIVATVYWESSKNVLAVQQRVRLDFYGNYRHLF